MSTPRDNSDDDDGFEPVKNERVTRRIKSDARKAVKKKTSQFSERRETILGHLGDAFECAKQTCSGSLFNVGHEAFSQDTRNLAEAGQYAASYLVKSLHVLMRMVEVQNTRIETLEIRVAVLKGEQKEKEKEKKEKKEKKKKKKKKKSEVEDVSEDTDDEPQETAMGNNPFALLLLDE